MSKEPIVENRYCRFYGIPNYRLWTVWRNMKARCYNHNNHGYKDYGGRGIKIYSLWLKHFLYFYDWAIENGYQDDLTIERIDVNGNYEPNNCKWISKKEQMRNKRNSHNITFNGETKCLEEWSNIYKINSKVIKFRMDNGMTFEEAVTKQNWRKINSSHVTKEIVDELYNELGEYKKVANALGTSRATVSRIKNNK